MAGQDRFTRVVSARAFEDSSARLPIRSSARTLLPRSYDAPPPLNSREADYSIAPQPSLPPERGWPDRLVVKTGGRVLLVRIEEIDWIDASGNYVTLHLGAEAHRMRETMAGIEARLDPARFLRIHRCTIVNIDRVRELQPENGPAFRGEYSLLLHDGTRLSISRSHRAQLHRFLNSAI